MPESPVVKSARASPRRRRRRRRTNLYYDESKATFDAGSVALSTTQIARMPGTKMRNHGGSKLAVATEDGRGLMRRTTGAAAK